MDLEWIAELMSSLGRIRTRRMFSGVGLYAGERIFGLILDETLYLKTDALTRPQFEQAGGRPFMYRSRDREVSIGYWTPPDDAFDSAEAMQPWARLAVLAAERAPPPRRKRAQSSASAGTTARSRR